MNKNNYFQMIRGICIFLVIVIHVLPGNTNLNIIIRSFVNFAVGVFIFLSGYFVNTEKVIEEPKKWMIIRLKRIGIPFILFSTLAAIRHLILYEDSLGKFLINIILGKGSPELYYLIALMQYIVMTPILIKILKSNKKFLNNCVILITPIYLIIIDILQIKFDYTLPMRGTIFPAWIIFYYLGLYYKMYKEKLNMKFNSKLVIILPICIAILNSIINVFMHSKGISYTYLTSQIKLTNMIYTIFIIFAICKLENKVKENEKIVKLGDLSFGIYLVHYYFTLIYKYLNIFENNILNTLFGTIIITIISYYSVYIIKKITKDKFIKILGF